MDTIGDEDNSEVARSGEHLPHQCGCPSSVVCPLCPSLLLYCVCVRVQTIRSMMDKLCFGPGLSIVVVSMFAWFIIK